MKCTKCGKELRSDNTKGICGAGTACKTRAAGASAPPTARKTKRVAPAEAPPASVEMGESWLTKFTRLHDALGLNAEAAIEKHCREWVEATTSRALGSPAAKPVRLHSRRSEEPGAEPSAGTGG